MYPKKIILFLLLLLLFYPASFASEKQRVFAAADGTICLFSQSKEELKISKSFDQGLNFSPLSLLYVFSPEAINCDIVTEANNFSLIYTASPESTLFFTQSDNNGKTFSSPKILSKGVKSSAIAAKDELISIIWEENGGLAYTNSNDKGLNFSAPQYIYLTGEALSMPSITMDNQKRVHIIYKAWNPDLNLNSVLYAQIEKGQIQPKTLYETHDEIKNLRGQPSQLGLLVYWQKTYFNRTETYLRTSFDYGQTFGEARILPDIKDISAIIFRGNIPFAGTGNGEAAFQEIKIPPPPLPQITCPAKISSNSSITFKRPGTEPLLCKIELSPEKDFPQHNSWNLNRISPAEMTPYTFPITLPNGNYFMRVSLFDGLMSGPATEPISFEVDNTPPIITSLEVERVIRNLTFSGRVSETPAWLTINENPITVEAGGRFSFKTILKPDQNSFTFSLSDEAGNMSTITKEVFYNVATPEIMVIKPQKDDWFKSDSTIFISAQVFDAQGDIADQSEARISFDNQSLEDTLVYDEKDGTLQGFISLPKEIRDGKHKCAVSLSDKKGNEGKTIFSINIDSSPPVVKTGPANLVYTNSADKFTLAFDEAGAGIDPASTLIKIAGISLEGNVSPESNGLTINALKSLTGVSFEVQVTPRDRVGNTGKPTYFYLVLDTTPPKLTLTGTFEPEISRSKITVSGQVEDASPISVTVYNNEKKEASLSVSGNRFSKEIKLVAGSNKLRIEATDLAGNTTSAEVQTFVNLAAAGLITDCINGPNPFSPPNESMVFSYSLSQAADIKIIIFDLTGTQIWSKEVKNTGSGMISWNGTNKFGNSAGNGVYPYILVANLGDTKEIKRGKIMVLK